MNELKAFTVDKEMTMESLVCTLLKQGLIKSNNVIYVEDGYKLCTISSDKIDTLNIENMAKPYIKDDTYNYTTKEGNKLCFFSPLGLLCFPVVDPAPIIISRSV
jgi:hypothetical protein